MSVSGSVEPTAARDKAIGERNDAFADRRPALYRALEADEPSGDGRLLGQHLLHLDAVDRRVGVVDLGGAALGPRSHHLVAGRVHHGTGPGPHDAWNVR